MSEQAHHHFDASSGRAVPAGAVAAVRCLIVPGLGGSGPEHWQSRWLRSRTDCARVELGQWDAPTRAGWIAAIDAAVRASPGPLALVGHSLGCLAIAWWAAEVSPAVASRVAGALLVAPPDVGQQGADLRLLRFAPVPSRSLPIPAIVVASTNDRYATAARSRALARDWGAAFVEIGAVGHINAESGLGDWPTGQALLAELIAERRR